MTRKTARSGIGMGRAFHPGAALSMRAARREDIGHVHARVDVLHKGKAFKTFSRHFKNVATAVGFFWAGKPGVRLEKGELTVPAKDEYLFVVRFLVDGRQLTTDDIVPALKEAKRRRDERKKTTEAVLRRLDLANSKDVG